MPRFLLICPVIKVDGTQTFAVEAADRIEAIKLFDEGHSKFVEEELEVVGLGEPEVELDNEPAEAEEGKP